MAIVRAVKSGNWSDTTVWNTGALPTTADDVYSNTFTVTIDTSPTVQSIGNGTTTGVTAGGNFVPTNGITLTCTATNGLVWGHTTPLFASSLTTGQSCTINGNISIITGSAFNGVVRNSLSGTININGNINPNIPGAVESARYGIHNFSTGIVNIVGEVRGCSTNGNSGGYGVFNESAGGIVNITGNCIAGTLASAVVNNSSGTITHIGTATASNNVPAIQSANTSAIVILSGPFIVSANGTHAVYCPNWKWQNTSPPATYYQIRSANLSTVRPLYTADSVGGNPAVTNVRSGTVYGPNNELTGTCAVPAAGSVVLGVPVDNTTGTAYITQSDIANALSTASAVTLNQQTSSLTTSGSIGERLKLVSTVATTAQQLSDALSNE